MIIRRYLCNEILQRFFWITSLVFLIYLSDRFIDLLGIVAASKISNLFIIKMLTLKLVYVLPKLLPATLFLAIILSYLRLINDNEITIIQTAGINQMDHLKIVFLTVMPICIFVAGMAFFISPWAQNKFTELRNHAKQNTEISSLIAGQFTEIGKDNQVVYIESISEQKIMQNVFLQINHDDNSGILTAASAKLEVDNNTGNQYMKFNHGYHYAGIPGQPDYRIIEYQTYEVLLKDNTPSHAAVETKAMPTATLLASGTVRHKAELQWRASLVLSCLLLSLLAVLLSDLAINKWPNLLILLSILIYFTYSNLLYASKSLAERGELPLIIGLWWVHVLLIAVMLIIYHAPRLRSYSLKTK